MIMDGADTNDAVDASVHDLPGEVEVLIVGYGPVGAALACLLGRYGVRTLVVDKSADIFMAPRAIALDNEALRILQMAGLEEEAFDKVPIPYVRMLCPHVGEFGRVNTSGILDGHPKLITFYQPELERALRDRAERHVSVTARSGVEMMELRDDGDSVRVTLRATGSEAPRVVRARYVVGADGASSRVRAAIGQEFVGKTYAEDWLVVDAVDSASTPLDHVEFLCDPKRPTPHMPAPRGRARWEFMLMPGETRDELESDAKVAELLRPWGGVDGLRIERKAVYRFHSRSCARYNKGRIFLAGDAAHITPPFVGQGLVAGLRDAANLAWKLAWVVKGRAAPAILESYDQERRPHAAKMIALARVMGHLVMPRSRVAAVLVHGTMALLRRLPFFRELVDELGIKPTNSYPKGLFARGRGRVRRGTWWPQGLVRSPSGERILSDEALGPELALAAFGGDPLRDLSDENRARWSSAGGRIMSFASSRGPGGASDFVDLDDALSRGGALDGWCVVVRPDRTILHDGPIEESDRVVRESLALLGNAPPEIAARTHCGS
jgi:3-(3-hydroxy-phenyl)propionate hydroxylase